MIGVGPFPMRVIVVALAALVAWAVARALARRLPDAGAKAAGAVLIDAFFVGLVAARAGYVLRWWQEYAAAPWSVISIGDGGFTWWIGLPVAIAFVLWHSRKRRELRRPVLAGIAAGMLAWAAAGGAFWWLQQSAPPLPSIALTGMDGQAVDLADYRGRPVVLNLWATWCPPCRREMPVLERAQSAWPDVAFVLVNQGEDAATIEGFLADEGLVLRDVLRDPHSRTMFETGARGLPTTLYFNAEGHLVDTHMGELTGASLADTLRRRFNLLPDAGPGTDRVPHSNPDPTE